MKKGDLRRVRIEGSGTWVARIIRAAKHGAYLIEWRTGPLKGREGRVLAENLKK